MSTSNQQSSPPSGRQYVLDHADLWEAYKADPDNPTKRNALAEKYFGWLYHLSHLFHRTRSDRYSVEELVSVGFLQMLKLFKTFRLDGGASFCGYSKLSILSAMTRVNVKCEPAFRARNSINAARRRESHRLGRRINDFELTQAMGVTEADLIKKLDHARGAFGRENSIEFFENIPSKCNELRAIHTADVNAVVSKAIEALPQDSALLVRVHYLCGTPINTIATRCGMSRQGVELHAQAARSHLRKLIPHGSELLN